MKTLHKVTKAPGVEVRAVEVPGGLLFVCDVWADTETGASVGVSSSFVPMTHEERREYLMELSAGGAA